MSRRSRVARLTASSVVGLLVVTLAVMVASGRITTPQRAEQASSPPAAAPVFADVERQQLVDRLITRGTVESVGAVSYNMALGGSGSARIEMLRLVGDAVDAGSAVALIDGRPVMVLPGDRQLAADVRPDSIGRDVELLQAGLRAIGADVPPIEDGIVGPLTQAAIAGLYQRAGVRPSTTSEPAGPQAAVGAGAESPEMKLARLRRAVEEAAASLDAAEAADHARPDPVAAALMALAAAQRGYDDAVRSRSTAVGRALVNLAAVRDAAVASTTTMVSSVPPDVAGLDHSSGISPVESAQWAVEDAGRAGDSAVAQAGAALDAANLQMAEALRSKSASAASAHAAVVSATNALTAAQSALAEAARRDGVVLPRAEVLFVPTLPTTVLSTQLPAQAASTVGGDAGGNLFSLRSGELAVGVDVPADMVLREGASGRADSDDGAIEVEVGYDATAARVPSPTGSTAGGDVGGAGSRTSTFQILSISRGEIAAGMNLRVTIEVPATDEPVLSVPVRAVVTTADGSTMVRRRTGRVTQDVSVTLGATGGGFVEVKSVSGTLDEGDEVLVT